jgi:putative inorganic carbon (hco3(-)) transporter
MRDLMFLVLFAVMIGLSYGRLFVCVLNWSWVSLVAPNLFMYGIGTMVPANKVVAGFTALAFLISKERKRLYIPFVGWLVLLLLLIASISQLTAVSDTDFGWGIYDRFWKIVVLFILVTSFVNTRDRIHALVLTAVIGVGFQAIADGLKFVVTAGHFHSVGNLAWGDNNQEGLFILMAVPLLTYLRNVMTDKLARLGLTAALVLFVLAILSTWSRGALVGLVVLGLAGVLVSKRKIPYIVAMVFVAIAITVVFPSGFLERADTIQTADQDASFMGRVVAWKMSTVIALDRPLGGGMESVQIHDVWDHYVPQFDRLSFIPTDPPLSAHAAHSIYFEALGDLGFPGLAVFLGILLLTLLGLHRTRKRAARIPELYWAERLAAQLQLAVVVYMVSGAALSAVYLDIPWLFFGISAAVGRVVAEQRRTVLATQRPLVPSRRAALAGLPAGPRPALR